jgi:hypothetical protein
MLLHVFPWHSVQATEHSRPCFLQLQHFESQFDLHLKYIVFRSSSGAGGKLDLIGTHMLCSIDHPQSFASICQPHRSIVSLDETHAKYESVQRLTSEAKTMPSTIEE